MEFKGGCEGTLGHYRTLARIFLERGNPRLARKLDRVDRELLSAAGAPAAEARADNRGRPAVTRAGRAPSKAT